MSHTIPRVNPHSILWLFEKNYHLLLRLFGDELTNSPIGMTLAYTQPQARLQCTIMETHRYMLVLQLHHQFNHSIVDPLQVTIRFYLDAAVAEVTALQNYQHIPPAYLCSVTQGEYPDEKRQTNQLLLVVLQYWLQRQHTLTAMELTG